MSNLLNLVPSSNKSPFQMLHREPLPLRCQCPCHHRKKRVQYPLILVGQISNSRPEMAKFQNLLRSHPSKLVPPLKGTQIQDSCSISSLTLTCTRQARQSPVSSDTPRKQQHQRSSIFVIATASGRKLLVIKASSCCKTSVLGFRFKLSDVWQSPSGIWSINSQTRSKFEQY